MKTEERGRPSLVAGDPGQPSSWSPTPSWLLLPAQAPDVPPPVETRPPRLPVDALTWEDFERLCLRLLELETERVHVSVEDPPEKATTPIAGQYGVSGQAQFGIDVYARDPLVPGETPPTRRYVSLQSRRIKKVTKAQLGSSVDKFLDGQWASVSRVFIYATSASTKSTELVDEIEELAVRLGREAIAFEVWDQDALSKRLKAHPETVDDFFGRPWVKRFCGEKAAEALGTRLDAGEVAELRHELAGVYRAAFGVADSGLIAFQFSKTRPVALLHRFVTPDLVSTTLRAASSPQHLDDLGAPGVEDLDLQTPLWEAAARNTLASDDDGWFLQRPARKQPRFESPRVEGRSADQWIAESPLQVVVGDPGAGKSTLLRYLVLDLLSVEPTWRIVAERWGQRLPVWLPFHFFTQRLAGHTGAPASVGQALKAWLDQHDAGHVWPLVQAALDDKRLLLVVDGLDEWINDSAGRTAFAVLKTFVDSRSIPVVVSTRPYGLTRLGLDASWTYARIAPLTPEQQRQLASHFFQAVADTEDHSSSSGVVERSVDTFPFTDS